VSAGLFWDGRAVVVYKDGAIAVLLKSPSISTPDASSNQAASGAAGASAAPVALEDALDGLAGLFMEGDGAPVSVAQTPEAGLPSDPLADASAAAEAKNEPSVKVKVPPLWAWCFPTPTVHSAYTLEEDDVVISDSTGIVFTGVATTLMNAALVDTQGRLFAWFVPALALLPSDAPLGLPLPARWTHALLPEDYFVADMRGTALRVVLLGSGASY
jgi:hypothetical protein